MTYIFVYYKIFPNEIPDLLFLISKVFAELKEKFPKIDTNILKRPELNKDGKETWMESYLIDDSSQVELIKDLLKKLVIKYKLPVLRNYEVFIKFS